MNSQIKRGKEKQMGSRLLILLSNRPFTLKQFHFFHHRRPMIHGSGHIRIYRPTASLGTREILSRFYY